MEHLTLLNLQLTEKIDLLNQFDLSNDLLPRQLEVLASFFQAYLAKPDMPILQEGATNHYFCLIAEGKADIVKNDECDQPKKIGSISHGKFVGEISFFDKGTCSASIIAQGEVKLLVMDNSHFKKLCEEESPLALHIVLRMIPAITQKLRHTTGRLVDRLQV